VLLPKIKKIPKNTNGRLAIPALAGLLVLHLYLQFYYISDSEVLQQNCLFGLPSQIIRPNRN